jgi:hypothetical protein
MPLYFLAARFFSPQAIAGGRVKVTRIACTSGAASTRMNANYALVLGLSEH